MSPCAKCTAIDKKRNISFKWYWFTQSTFLAATQLLFLQKFLRKVLYCLFCMLKPYCHVVGSFYPICLLTNVHSAICSAASFQLRPHCQISSRIQHYSVCVFLGGELQLQFLVLLPTKPGTDAQLAGQNGAQVLFMGFIF